MKGLGKYSDLHKRMFSKLVEETGIDVSVYQPPIRVPVSGSSDADRARGRRPAPASPGPSKVIKAVVSNSLTAMPEALHSAPSTMPFAFSVNSDILIRVRLEDVLVDPDMPQGATLFSTCESVEVNGTKFEVTGVERTGLPPAGPYILWVGLKQLGGVA